MKLYGFFPGCAYKNAAGYKESVDAVNQVLGIKFQDINDWNCCGATASFSLNETQALGLCGRLFALARHQGLSEIVTVCNACFTTLKKAGKLLNDHPERLEETNKFLAGENLFLEKPIPVRHHLDVLVNDISSAIWEEKTKGNMDGIHAAPYYGCQYSRPWDDGVDAERPRTMALLFHKMGLTAVDHSALTLCCGASHAVPYEKDCSVLINRIINAVTKKGANLVTTICPMCQFNLDARQKGKKSDKIPVTYFTQLIGLCLGIDPQHLGLDKLLVSADKVLVKAS